MDKWTDTILGSYAKRIAKVTTDEVMRKAITPLVLAEMSDLNTKGQLSKGERADGTILPDYSPISVEVYGRPKGAIKLHDTGEFYSSIDYDLRGGRVVADYDDTKEGGVNLVEEYGNIIGLNNESRKFIIPEIRENIINIFKP